MLSARTLTLFNLSLLVVVCANAIAAQELTVPTNTAPPPAKVISAEVRAQLDRSGDNKGRVKKTIELAEARLTQAETYTTGEKHSEASSELGKYWALIEDVFRHLSPLNADKTKTRDLYKRVELALRAHGTRLAMIRRTTPLEYAVWVKEIEDFTRASRTEALNSFYGQTVVREEPKTVMREESKTVVEKSPKNALTSPESKQP